MENKNLIIAVVVAIIALKLIAVHLYLKKKFNEKDDSVPDKDDELK